MRLLSEGVQIRISRDGGAGRKQMAATKKKERERETSTAEERKKEIDREGGDRHPNASSSGDTPPFEKRKFWILAEIPIGPPKMT